MQTTRPTMKQFKCRHPSGALVRGIDPRFETCRACGFTRLAPVMAPWLIAYDEEHPPVAPPLFAELAEPVAPVVAPVVAKERGPAYDVRWMLHTALWQAARADLLQRGDLDIARDSAWFSPCSLIVREPSRTLFATVLAPNHYECCRLHELFYRPLAEALARCDGRPVELSITSAEMNPQFYASDFRWQLAEVREEEEPAAV